MSKTIYANWGGHNVKLTWILSDTLPDITKVTSVHGYCFYQGKVLLVHVKGRGFDIPGGHVEQGESPEQAFHREAYEEGYVKGELRYLGMIEVSHEDNPLYQPGGKYPLVGYQLFYRMDIDQSLPFQRENESTSRIWVEPEEIAYVMNDHELSLLVLEEALKRG
ncbi:DNA mismatch repair protein MutT [Gordoniibacillus kamchatkensis]|uniref:DNA mismatch repair protein MutT n=1 Tax=Gordoniibacillus kamchatkensis TaxID=1590651 RepID=A0ABR5ACL2_9BACL|nr:NUDIX domain-containing protein [Paenibacillus sp. VKM B-2647]KIL38784.1 DNA mismatch repair protein MutT [Paenibacillus sp. VKM B-2647]